MVCTVTVTLWVRDERRCERYVGTFPTREGAAAWTEFVKRWCDAEPNAVARFWKQLFKDLNRVMHFAGNAFRVLWEEYLAQQSAGTLPCGVVWRREKLPKGFQARNELHVKCPELLRECDDATGNWTVDDVIYYACTPLGDRVPPSADVFDGVKQ